jgi:hypothetical protein
MDALQRALYAEAAAGAAGGGALGACMRAGGGYSARSAAGRVHPDSSCAEALAALNSSGLRHLPVVSRAEGGAAAQVVGLLEADGVGDACARELTVRALNRRNRADLGTAQQVVAEPQEEVAR